MCILKVTKIDGINSFFFFAWQLLPTTYVQCYQGYYREHELIRWTVSQTVPRTHGVLPVITRKVPITYEHGQIMWIFVIFIVVLKTVIKIIMLSMSFWTKRWDAGPWPHLLLSQERGKKYRLCNISSVYSSIYMFYL